jgi:hypothetical protein
LRFSAVAPNLAAVFRSKLIPEDTNFGRDCNTKIKILLSIIMYKNFVIFSSSTATAAFAGTIQFQL